MSISAVEDAIRQVRQQLADYPTSDYLYNEATTRNVIINPMLEALGWDLRNLDQCGYEIDPKGELWGKKPADYVLGAPSGRTMVIVEAKRMSNGLTTERVLFRGPPHDQPTYHGSDRCCSIPHKQPYAPRP